MPKLNIKILIFIVLLYSNTLSDTLKIVYNSSTPPLKFTDDQNKANGMLIDIWKLWSKKNNINIEFIEAPWKDTLSMIKNGKADIHVGIYYTKERELFLDYSEKPLYRNKSYFFYNKKIANIQSIENLNPFVIGTGNGYPDLFIKENYPKLLTKQFRNANDLKESFVNNKVSVVLSSMAGMNYFIQKNNYDAKQYRFTDQTHAYTKDYFGAVKKGNTKVLNLINKGFEKVSKDELLDIENRWTSSLNNNYLKEYNNRDINKNEKYTKYLEQKKEIKVCVDPNWLPFEAIEEGKHVGIIADIFNEFKNYLPIPITLVQTKTWSDSIKFIKNGKCDILSGVTRTKNRQNYLDFTQSYIKFPHVLVTREIEPFIDEFDSVLNKKIGVVKNTAIVELFKQKYPNITFIEVENVVDGLLLVSQGELFGFVDGSASVSYYISQEGLTNLKIASKVGINYYLSVGVKKDETVLLDIFNNMLHHIDTNKITNIKNQWLRVKFEELVDYSIIYQTIIFFIIIIVIILYWNRKLNNEIIEKEKLEKELNKLSQVIEQSNVSVVITDIDGKIEYSNPFASLKSGYTKEELLGVNPRIFQSGYQDVDFYIELWSTIKKGNTWQGEFSNKDKNGQVFWESALITPIFGKDNSIKYFASIKEDITDKVKARDKLQIAQNEVIKASAAKSEFLAKMSHEIRTPMNAVLGMLYLLEKTDVTSFQSNYIKKANRAASSLLGIINDILDFSKIEAGKLDINHREFEFNEMLSDVLSVMSFKAEEKDLELLASYDDLIPHYILCDKLRIEQILTNLISNAIKFTSVGEIIVSTKLIKENKDTIDIMFCVKDSGIGIAEESKIKLFQEFSQVDNSATRSFGGTGLGLVISKKLTELLGGEIWIDDSIEGVGTTFCFTIKCKKVNNTNEKFFHKEKIKNLKCLVVDDNQSAIEVLSKMLMSFDYTVISASSGNEAIEIVNDEKFDIIFLDYKMNGLNGVETFKKIKQKLILDKTKTIMISAYSQEIVDENIQNIGIEGYLSKPVAPSALYNKIFEVQNAITQNSLMLNEASEPQILEYFNNMNLLLVEDNELNQEFALHMLQERGFIVDIASDGIESLSKVKSKRYDMILMDIQMPHMDGLEATKHIRNMDNKYYRNVPIIALSANALVGDKEKSLEAGMNNHISKPINPQELFEVIGQYLSSEKKEIYTDDTLYPNDFNIDQLNNEIFDVKNTLDKLNNNYEIYVKILKQFQSNYENIFSEIQKYIEDKDNESLSLKIHEIKGVSGNIGAIKLYEKIVRLDKIINTDNIPSYQMLDEFNHELTLVLNAITNLDSQRIESKEFDKKTVMELLVSLENNLEEDIVKSDAILQEVIPYLSISHEEFSHSLSSALDEFDTDKAKELIEQFIRNVK